MTDGMGAGGRDSWKPYYSKLSAPADLALATRFSLKLASFLILIFLEHSIVIPSSERKKKWGRQVLEDHLYGTTGISPVWDYQSHQNLGGQREQRPVDLYRSGFWSHSIPR